MKKVNILAYMGILIAMYTLLAHIVPVVKIDTLQISFGFVPLGFGSMLLGPIIGGIVGAIGDIIGMILAPKGAYFPGFTLNVFLSGLIYGIFLYKKPKTVLRISLAVFCVNVFVNIGINTYWLTIILGKGYMAMLPGRVIKNVLMMPVQISVLYLMWKYAGCHIEKYIMKQPSKV